MLPHIAQFLRYWKVPRCYWACNYWAPLSGDQSDPEQDITDDIRESKLSVS